MSAPPQDARRAGIDILINGATAESSSLLQDDWGARAEDWVPLRYAVRQIEALTRFAIRAPLQLRAGAGSLSVPSTRYPLLTPHSFHRATLLPPRAQTRSQPPFPPECGLTLLRYAAGCAFSPIPAVSSPLRSRKTTGQ